MSINICWSSSRASLPEQQSAELRGALYHTANVTSAWKKSWETDEAGKKQSETENDGQTGTKKPKGRQKQTDAQRKRQRNERGNKCKVVPVL
jgi:hypothetical protein